MTDDLDHASRTATATAGAMGTFAPDPRGEPDRPTDHAYDGDQFADEPCRRMLSPSQSGVSTWENAASNLARCNLPRTAHYAVVDHAFRPSIEVNCCGFEDASYGEGVVCGATRQSHAWTLDAAGGPIGPAGEAAPETVRVQYGVQRQLRHSAKPPEEAEPPAKGDGLVIRELDGSTKTLDEWLGEGSKPSVDEVRGALAAMSASDVVDASLRAITPGAQIGESKPSLEEWVSDHEYLGDGERCRRQYSWSGQTIVCGRPQQQHTSVPIDDVLAAKARDAIVRYEQQHGPGSSVRVIEPARDTGYAPERWTFDGEVSRVFDDMFARSIPQYEVMRATVLDVAQRYAQDRTDIVDLGAARGESIAQLYERRGGYNRYVAVEVSEPMLAALRQRFAGLIAQNIVEVNASDLRERYPSVSASVTLAVLTLVFVPINYRQRVLRAAYQHTKKGGAIILVEKVLGATADIDSLMVTRYHAMKGQHGYSADEIERKRLALEGVQVPVTADWNVDLLRQAGFRQIDCFWRWMNFCAWIGVRDD